MKRFGDDPAEEDGYFKLKKWMISLHKESKYHQTSGIRV